MSAPVSLRTWIIACVDSNQRRVGWPPRPHPRHDHFAPDIWFRVSANGCRSDDKAAVAIGRSRPAP